MGTRDEWDSYELYDGVSILKKTFSANLGQDQTITERVCPLIVTVDETSNWYPTGDPSQVNSDLYAAWFMVQVGLEPTGSTTILRLESNTKGITLGSVFDCVCSGVPAGDFDYMFRLHPGNISAWQSGGTVGTEDGWIKIKVAAEDKYIQLYNSITA